MTLHDGPSSPAPIAVQFWGVRGSIACPGPRTSRYGGNTPCVEVRCGAHTLIFDAGTGIRAARQRARQIGQHHRLRYLPEPRPHRSHRRPAVLRTAVREGPGGPRLGRQPAAGRRREGGRPQADELSVLSAPGRRAACQARVPRLPRRRPDQAAAGRHAADRAAQSSGRRDRLPDRVRRPLGRLRDRYRDRRWPDRSGAGVR